MEKDNSKIEFSQDIINDMIDKIIKLDSKNNTNHYEKIVVLSSKTVPVSIITVTEENKEFLSNKFNFSKSEYGVNAKINNDKIKVGVTDNVQNYTEMPIYFDENGILKTGISIMVQDTNDIFLTDEKTKDLGYTLNNSFDKIKLPGDENNQLSDLMSVQTKEKFETIIKMDALFNLYNKIMIDFIKQPSDLFINTGKIQQLNKDGYIVVKNNKIAQVVNEENGYAKGYIPKEKQDLVISNVNNSNVNLFKNKLEFFNDYTKKVYDISSLTKEEKILLEEEMKNIRLANNFLLKNNKDNKYIKIKSNSITNLLIKLDKYLISNEFIKEINTQQTLITIATDDENKIGFIKSKIETDKYMIPKSSLDDFDLKNPEDVITKTLFKKTGVAISNDSLDLLEKDETKTNYFENIYQAQLSRKESKKILENQNNQIHFLSFEEIKEMLKKDLIKENSLIALEKLFKYDNYFKLKFNNDSEIKTLMDLRKKITKSVEIPTDTKYESPTLIKI